MYHHKSIINYVITLNVLMMLAGCCISVGHSGKSRRRPHASGTIAEINAAAQLSFDNDKAARLKSIAKRKHLKPCEQVHLVNITLKNVSFSNSQTAILLTLIKNPNLSLKAKDSILNQINRISFSNSQRAILDAIDKHGPCIDEYPNEPAPAPPLEKAPAKQIE